MKGQGRLSWREIPHQSCSLPVAAIGVAPVMPVNFPAQLISRRGIAARLQSAAEWVKWLAEDNNSTQTLTIGGQDYLRRRPGAPEFHKNGPYLGPVAHMNPEGSLVLSSA